MKKINKRTLIRSTIGVVIIGLLSTAIYFSVSYLTWMPEKKLVEVSTKFINKELLQGQGTASVKVVGRENGLYKLEVDYNGQKINSFASRDGKILFPQSYEMISDAKSNDPSTAKSEMSKNDKPEVELFVMSHCPYGLQIEKGILPVIKTLGSKIDFKLKFTNYAMHGEKELAEQLKQYCIQKDEPSKLLSYLECFIETDDSESCISKSEINQEAMEACVTETNEEYKVTENFNSKVGYKGSYPGFEVFKTDNDKYSVAGSPTLIINGSESKSGRDSKSLLDSICSAFNNPPEECSTSLSSDAPSPGFGSATSQPSNSSGGNCNN
jgi:hypothetical protein